MRLESNRSVASVFAAVALTVPLCLLASCASAEGRLDKLRTDPMASYELPSALSTQTSEMVGGFCGVCSPSRIRRTFTVPPGEGEVAIAEIAAAAVDADWNLEENGRGGFGGLKRINGINAQLRIIGLISDDVVWFELYSRTGQNE